MKNKVDEMKKDIRTVLLHNCKYDYCECVIVGFNEEGIARELYDEGYRKQEWISVQERLPEIEGKYLAYTRKGTIAICDYRSYFMTKEGALSEPQFDYLVTHWMPLPEAPKGE